jgi:hypothetical protein
MFVYEKFIHKLILRHKLAIYGLSRPREPIVLVLGILHYAIVSNLHETRI